MWVFVVVLGQGLMLVAQVSLQPSCLSLSSAGVKGLSLAWFMDDFKQQKFILTFQRLS